MNQRRQGGGQRGRQQVQQQNQQGGGITAGQAYAEIMNGVARIEPQIRAVLPGNVPFNRFRATLMMALRHNPDIMKCSITSIVTGAIKAAIDGVLLDGKEAALVPSNNRVKDFETGREHFRKDARYNIMIAGIRKSIMLGGKVRDFQTTVVYRNEAFKYNRGLNPDLTHTPILDQEKRGDAVGAYSIAWFTDGGFPSFEVMNKAEIEAVRDMAQSGPVWKGPMVLEMWRKTVARRHRKSLPGQETIVDQEAAEAFGFTPAYEMGDPNSGVLPATQQSADAPRRADFQQLEHHGGEAGMPLDFGNSGEISREEFEREEQGEAVQEQQRAAAPAQEQQKAEPEPRTVGPVPEGFETWEAWEADVTSKMKVATTLPKLDQVTKDTQASYDVAPDDVRQRLADLYEEKATDHREAAK